MIIGGDILGSGMPAGGGSAAIIVIEVLWVQPNVLQWTFNHPLTVSTPLDGDVSFEVDDGAGFSTPNSMVNSAANVIQMTYDGDDNFNVFGGDAWRITLTPTNVDEVDDLTIPQTGTTTGLL